MPSYLNYPVPPLPANYIWVGRCIVHSAETIEGELVLRTVITGIPENFELLMDFLNAWGELFRQRGFEQGSQIR